MKKIVLMLLAVLAFAVDANAVLKEKDLDNTLKILRMELTEYHKELSLQNTMGKEQGEKMRKQLMSVLQRSNQNALMLYSQKSDYVFDLTYACHEATEQYQYFQQAQLPFRLYLEKTATEVARYDSLIQSLRKMPTAMLGQQAKTDRSVCLALATNIRNTLTENSRNTKDFIEIYDLTEERLKGVNDYANRRYNEIQTNIFQNGGDDFFTILSNLPQEWKAMVRTVGQKYQSSPSHQSQWDSALIVWLFVAIVFYAIIASAFNLVVMRYLVPRRFRTEEFMKKRACITMATTAVTFALILGVVLSTTTQNFIAMACNLLVEYAWLMSVILISLLLRLDAQQIKSAFRIYSPLMLVGFLVITFRIVLIPNELVNIVFPPVLLLCALWQWNVIKRHNRNIPRSDMFYTYTSQAVFVTSIVCSWAGYTLLSVQILIWWVMQLTCILTIACVTRWLRLYGQRKHFDDKPITSTWLHRLVCDVCLPVMYVASVMISIYWAADVFNLSDLCWDIFSRNYIDQPTMKVSIVRVALVVSLWFLFDYVNKTAKELLRLHFLRTDPSTAESRNMMGKNLLQVFVWGAWLLLSLGLLGISFTWLVVVSGGLSTGIGFASKDIIENIYYGISLMAGRIKVGDLIECDGVRGKVSSISYTSTLLEATDGSVIAFQNSQLFTKNYKNLTRNHGYELASIVFGIAYGSNVKEVCQMVEKAVGALHHPLLDPEKQVRAIVTDFGDNSVNMKLYCWVDVLKRVYAESDVKACIYDTLNHHGIEIPFPQCDVHVKELPAKN